MEKVKEPSIWTYIKKGWGVTPVHEVIIHGASITMFLLSDKIFNNLIKSNYDPFVQFVVKLITGLSPFMVAIIIITFTGILLLRGGSLMEKEQEETKSKQD